MARGFLVSAAYALSQVEVYDPTNPEAKLPFGVTVDRQLLEDDGNVKVYSQTATFRNPWIDRIPESLREHIFPLSQGTALMPGDWIAWSSVPSIYREGDTEYSFVHAQIIPVSEQGRYVRVEADEDELNLAAGTVHPQVVPNF